MSKTQEALRVERALKLALEALKMCRGVIRNNIENLVPIESPNPWFSQDVDHAITAIREALASEASEQPAQQEPVAFSQFLSDVVTAAGLLSHGKTDKSLAARISEFAFRLRTSPQSKPWVGLTDGQITAGARALCQQMAEACNVDAGDQWKLYADTFKEDAKAVLTAAAKLREKNA